MGCGAAFMLKGPSQDGAVAIAMQLAARAPEFGGQGTAVKYRRAEPSGMSSGAGLPASALLQGAGWHAHTRRGTCPGDPRALTSRSL